MEVSTIVEGLPFESRILMAAIARTAKTRGGNFSEGALKQKRACWEIDVPRTLKGLQARGLVVQVSPAKRLWRVTHIGKLVEHECLAQERRDRYPGVAFR